MHTTKTQTSRNAATAEAIIAHCDALERAALQGESGLEVLVQGLCDTAVQVRETAFCILRERPSEPVAVAVIPLIDCEDPEVEEMVRRILVACGEQAVRPLLAQLAASRRSRRLRSIEILGELRSRAAVPHLIEMLDEADEQTADAAIAALGQIGDQRACIPLIALARRRPERLTAVLHALYQLPSSETDHYLLNLLQNKNPALQMQVLHALSGSRSIETAQTLQARLADFEREVQLQALKTIYAILSGRNPIEAREARVIPATSYRQELIELLHQDAPASIELILRSLPAEFVSEILPEFIDLIAHPSEEVRYQIRQYLQRFQPEQVVAAFEACRRQISEGGCLSLATWLAEQDFALAMPLLKRLAQSQNADIRIVVAQCLALRPDNTDTVLLRRLLSDPDPFVQESAFLALAQLPDYEFLPLLIEGLSHDLSVIREVCAEMLAKIAPATFSEILVQGLMHGDADERKFVLMLSCKFPGFVEATHLLGRLQSDDPVARMYATKALAVYTTPEVRKHLFGRLEDPDRDGRLAALEGLLFAGGETAFRAADIALRSGDPALQAKALEAIVAHRWNDMAPHLFPLLETPDMTLRRLAIHALLDLLGEEAVPAIRSRLEGRDAAGVALVDDILEARTTEFG